MSRARKNKKVNSKRGLNKTVVDNSFLFRPNALSIFSILMQKYYKQLK